MRDDKYPNSDELSSLIRHTEIFPQRNGGKNGVKSISNQPLVATKPYR